MILINPEAAKNEAERVNAAFTIFDNRVTALEAQIRELDHHLASVKLEFTNAYETACKKVEELAARLKTNELRMNEINENVLSRLQVIETALEMSDLDDADLKPPAKNGSGENGKDIAG